MSNGELEIYTINDSDGSMLWVASTILTGPDHLIGPLPNGAIVRFVKRLDNPNRPMYSGPKKEEAKKMQRMSRGEALALSKQIARALADAEKLFAKYGEDPPIGAVIRFVKHFPANAVMSAEQWQGQWGPRARAALEQQPLIDYYYAGIKASNGQWYLTGESKSVKTDGIEWEELLDWLDSGIPVEKLEIWPPAGQSAIENGNREEASYGSATDEAAPELRDNTNED